MDAGGKAKATQEGKANQLRIANLFLKWLPDESLKAQAGDDWNKIPEVLICAFLLWRYLATYLSEVHEIEAGKRNAGQHLKNVEAIWSDLFFEAGLCIASTSSLDASKVPRAAPSRVPCSPDPSLAIPPSRCRFFCACAHPWSSARRRSLRRRSSRARTITGGTRA